MTLRQLHARRSECLGLEGGLDALGDYLQRSCAQQRRQPVQPVRWRLVGSNLTHGSRSILRKSKWQRVSNARFAPESVVSSSATCAPVLATPLRASRPSWSGTPRSVTSSISCFACARSPDLLAAYSTPPRPRISGGTLTLMWAVSWLSSQSSNSAATVSITQ